MASILKILKIFFAVLVFVVFGWIRLLSFISWEESTGSTFPRPPKLVAVQDQHERLKYRVVDAALRYKRPETKYFLAPKKIPGQVIVREDVSPYIRPGTWLTAGLPGLKTAHIDADVNYEEFRQFGRNFQHRRMELPTPVMNTFNAPGEGKEEKKPSDIPLYIAMVVALSLILCITTAVCYCKCLKPWYRRFRGLAPDPRGMFDFCFKDSETTETETSENDPVQSYPLKVIRRSRYNHAPLHQGKFEEVKDSSPPEDRRSPGATSDTQTSDPTQSTLGANVGLQTPVSTSLQEELTVHTTAVQVTESTTSRKSPQTINTAEVTVHKAVDGKEAMTDPLLPARTQFATLGSRARRPAGHSAADVEAQREQATKLTGRVSHKPRPYPGDEIEPADKPLITRPSENIDLELQRVIAASLIEYNRATSGQPSQPSQDETSASEQPSQPMRDETTDSEQPLHPNQDEMAASQASQDEIPVHEQPSSPIQNEAIASEQPSQHIADTPTTSNEPYQPSLNETTSSEQPYEPNPDETTSSEQPDGAQF